MKQRSAHNRQKFIRKGHGLSISIMKEIFIYSKKYAAQTNLYFNSVKGRVFVKKGLFTTPQLPENFAFDVYHECGWGCRGSFVPSRYNSSRAKCIRCSFCQLFFSPNKFIFHSHRLPESRYVQPDAANFNSWRRHMKLCGDPPEEVSSQIKIAAIC